MKIIIFMKKYISRHKAETGAFILLSLALWALSIISPFIVGRYIDNLVAGFGTYVIYRAVITLAVIWTLQLILTYIKSILGAKLNALIGFDVRFGIIEHLKRLPLRYFSDKDSAYINQRVSSDSGNVTGFVLGSVVGLLSTFLTFTFALGIMFSLNFCITLMICLIFPIYIFIYMKFRQPLYELSYKLAEESDGFFARINKQLANIKLIKQNAWGDYTGAELTREFSSLFKTTMKNAKLSYVFNNADALVKYMANMIIFIYSGFQIIAGEMSIGQFTMINSYSLMVISSLSVFLGFGRSYRNSLVAYDRINEIYSTKQEDNGDINIDAVNEIAIKDLNFYYGERHVIKNLNARFEKGKIYVIAGENGSGKSTLLNIISGMIGDYSGDVYYNGFNLKDLNIYYLRKKCLTVVEQEPVLYFETLKENITFDNDKEQMIDNWVRRLGLSELIASLPGNIEYQISENTANLSGGEKQRLAEVRAFVKNSDVLIMDEPSSALDKGSLGLLCEILQEIKSDKIIIVVTHDQMMMEISDEIIQLDG